MVEASGCIRTATRSMDEHCTAVARTWDCTELVCAIAGAMDAPSLLALRATSGTFRDLLSNDERLFEGAFRRTFPLHRNTGWRERALAPVFYGSRWRARCVRRLAVEATHEATGIGFSDLARSWPLSYSVSPLFCAAEDDRAIDTPLLAETLRHHLESNAKTTTAKLPSPALHALLRWSVQYELYDVVLACSVICVSRLERLKHLESPEKRQQHAREVFLLERSASLALKQSCRDGRAAQLARLLRVWSVPPTAVGGSGATAKRYPSWLCRAVQQQLIGRKSVPTDPAVLEQLMVSDLLCNEEHDRTAIAADALIAACSVGRADTVRWLQTHFLHVFYNVPHLRSAVLAALSSGRDEVVRLLWSEYLCHWSPSKRAKHLAGNIDRVAKGLVPLFLSMLCDVRLDVSQAFRRFLCRGRDSDACAVRQAVRSAGYRCSPKDWNAALDFVALRGQVSLLDELIDLSDEACVGYQRCATSDAMRRRMAAAMNADDRRVKLWALARREVTASARADLLRMLEMSATNSTAKALDAALVGMCRRLHENDCPYVEDENDTSGPMENEYDEADDYADPETEGHDERFVAWTCADRRNELVLDSLLHTRSMLPPVGWDEQQLAELFLSVVCASPTADIARSWLSHPASDASFASLREDSAEEPVHDPAVAEPATVRARFFYKPRMWARQLARVASDDVFALLLAEERLLPTTDRSGEGHVQCALLRCLLAETSGSDDERVALRLRLLLDKISFMGCCEHAMDPIENVVLDVVLRGREKVLRALLADSRFDPSARNNAALRLAVWLQRPGEPPSPIREMLSNDARVRDRARMLRLDPNASSDHRSHPMRD